MVKMSCNRNYIYAIAIFEVTYVDSYNGQCNGQFDCPISCHVLIKHPLMIPLKIIVTVLSMTRSHHILSYRNKSIKDHVSSCREYWVPVALPQILVL